jgi:hypothetical protein
MIFCGDVLPVVIYLRQHFGEILEENVKVVNPTVPHVLIMKVAFSATLDIICTSTNATTLAQVLT